LGSKIIQEKNNEKETVIIDEVTRTTVQDVTQVVESDSPLTDEQQKVYEILKKKQEINAIAVKERSADENKKLKQYLYELTKIKSNIIEDLLKKFPELRKQTKTGAQWKSASRSRQDEQQTNEERKETDFISVKCVPQTLVNLQRKGEDKLKLLLKGSLHQEAAKMLTLII